MRSHMERGMLGSIGDTSRRRIIFTTFHANPFGVRSDQPVYRWLPPKDAD